MEIMVLMLVWFIVDGTQQLGSPFGKAPTAIAQSAVVVPATTCEEARKTVRFKDRRDITIIVECIPIK